jgi:hypothetical protein
MAWISEEGKRRALVAHAAQQQVPDPAQEAQELRKKEIKRMKREFAEQASEGVMEILSGVHVSAVDWKVHYTPSNWYDYEDIPATLSGSVKLGGVQVGASRIFDDEHPEITYHVTVRRGTPGHWYYPSPELSPESFGEALESQDE